MSVSRCSPSWRYIFKSSSPSLRRSPRSPGCQGVSPNSAAGSSQAEPRISAEGSISLPLGVGELSWECGSLSNSVTSTVPMVLQEPLSAVPPPVVGDNALGGLNGMPPGGSVGGSNTRFNSVAVCPANAQSFSTGGSSPTPGLTVLGLAISLQRLSTQAEAVMRLWFAMACWRASVGIVDGGNVSCDLARSPRRGIIPARCHHVVFVLTAWRSLARRVRHCRSCVAAAARRLWQGQRRAELRVCFAQWSFARAISKLADSVLLQCAEAPLSTTKGASSTKRVSFASPAHYSAAARCAAAARSAAAALNEAPPSRIFSSKRVVNMPCVASGKPSGKESLQQLAMLSSLLTRRWWMRARCESFVRWHCAMLLARQHRRCGCAAASSLLLVLDRQQRVTSFVRFFSAWRLALRCVPGSSAMRSLHCMAVWKTSTRSAALSEAKGEAICFAGFRDLAWCGLARLYLHSWRAHLAMNVLCRELISSSSADSVCHLQYQACLAWRLALLRHRRVASVGRVQATWTSELQISLIRTAFHLWVESCSQKTTGSKRSNALGLGVHGHFMKWSPSHPNSAPHGAVACGSGISASSDVASDSVAFADCACGTGSGTATTETRLPEQSMASGSVFASGLASGALNSSCYFSFANSLESMPSQTSSHHSYWCLPSNFQGPSTRPITAARCRQGHGLLFFPFARHCDDCWLCALCGSAGAPVSSTNTIHSGSRFRCEPCNYDVCGPCASKSSSRSRSQVEHPDQSSTTRRSFLDASMPSRGAIVRRLEPLLTEQTLMPRALALSRAPLSFDPLNFDGLARLPTVLLNPSAEALHEDDCNDDSTEDCDAGLQRLDIGFGPRDSGSDYGVSDRTYSPASTLPAVDSLAGMESVAELSWWNSLSLSTK